MKKDVPTNRINAHKGMDNIEQACEEKHPFLYEAPIFLPCWVPPPPLCENNTPVGATADVVSASFRNVSYFALCRYAPVSEHYELLFPSIFGTLVLLLQRGGGVGSQFGGVYVAA